MHNDGVSLFIILVFNNCQTTLKDAMGRLHPIHIHVFSGVFSELEKHDNNYNFT